MSSKGGAEKREANARMAASQQGAKPPEASRQGVGRMALWFECQQPAKEEYWRRVLADPETYGDLLGEARRIMEHHGRLARQAQARYNFLLSLSPKEGQ